MHALGQPVEHALQHDAAVHALRGTARVSSRPSMATESATHTRNRQRGHNGRQGNESKRKQAKTYATECHVRYNVDSVPLNSTNGNAGTRIGVCWLSAGIG